VAGSGWLFWWFREGETSFVHTFCQPQGKDHQLPTSMALYRVYRTIEVLEAASPGRSPKHAAQTGGGSAARGQPCCEVVGPLAIEEGFRQGLELLQWEGRVRAVVALLRGPQRRASWPRVTLRLPVGGLLLVRQWQQPALTER